MILLFSLVKLTFQLIDKRVRTLSCWSSSITDTILDDRAYLEKALTILEFASRRSKHKYQIRILMVNIYRLLGASLLALQHYDTLQVKQIQYDTLSHLVLSRGSTFSVASGTNSIQTAGISAVVWYPNGIADATEMPVKAFHLDRYNKVSASSPFFSDSSDDRSLD